MNEWQIAEKIVGAIKEQGDKILLHGPAGTGKSHQACRWCGDSMYRINLHEEKPAAELVGMFQPHPTPNGPEFVFRKGPAALAWIEGKGLVIDEIDKAGGDVLDILLALLDDRQMACMTLASGETIRPADGFFVVATMNGEPEDLPAPLRDRFQVCLRITKPHPDAIAALPEDLRQPAQNTTLDDPERSISVRRWNAFAKLRVKVEPELAAVAVFGARSQDVLAAVKLAGAPPEQDRQDHEVECGCRDCRA